MLQMRLYTITLIFLMTLSHLEELAPDKEVSTGESFSPNEIKLAPPPHKLTAEPSESLTTAGASEVDDMTRTLIASTMAAFRRNS